MTSLRAAKFAECRTAGTKIDTLYKAKYAANEQDLPSSEITPHLRVKYGYKKNYSTCKELAENKYKGNKVWRKPNKDHY